MRDKEQYLVFKMQQLYFIINYYYYILNVETRCMYKSLFSIYPGDKTHFLLSVLVNHKLRSKLPWLHNVLPRLSQL